MKKVITLCLITIIAGILFSSCRSSMSMIKRHYNSGYYFAHSKRNAVKQKHQEKTTLVRAKESAILVLNTKTVVTNARPQQDFAAPVVSNRVVNQAKTNNLISNKEPAGKTTEKIGSTKEPLAQFKRSFSGHKEMSGSAAQRDGLSLFWIIILVLLILWAFGFASGGFGLGPLINLLLVVALILLILWLLRII